MIELVSAALALLWAVCITLRCVLADVKEWGTHPRALTTSRSFGVEARHIGRLGGRVVQCGCSW